MNMVYVFCVVGETWLKQVKWSGTTWVPVVHTHNLLYIYPNVNSQLTLIKIIVD